MKTPFSPAAKSAGLQTNPRAPSTDGLAEASADRAFVRLAGAVFSVLLFLLCLALCIWKLPRGTAITDEALYLTIPYRFLQGDTPLLHEWHVTQLAGLLLLPLLRQAGFEVCGLYMDNADEQARLDALSAAERMGVPLRVLDVHAALEERVCRPFADCYLRGETPNPCILCNPTLKFRALLDEAERVGAERLGTSRIVKLAMEQEKLSGAPDEAY